MLHVLVITLDRFEILERSHANGHANRLGDIHYGNAGSLPYGPVASGGPALEAEEGGHRAKSVQAAPGVADDHRCGQALGPV